MSSAIVVGATEAIVAQIDRFAPGFRDHIVGAAVRTTTQMSTYNPNYIGGDIIGGASSPKQSLFRPRLATDPYFTGVPGTYLCSASTPPSRRARDVRRQRRRSGVVAARHEHDEPTEQDGELI